MKLANDRSNNNTRSNNKNRKQNMEDTATCSFDIPAINNQLMKGSSKQMAL